MDAREDIEKVNMPGRPARAWYLVQGNVEGAHHALDSLESSETLPFRLQEALEQDGVFFDTSDEVWDLLTEGGIDPWLVNEAFLMKQLDVGVERIEFVGEDILDIITSPDTSVRNSFRAKEIRCLLENMEEYGYVLDGNAWVRR
jgi:hypothetical protein